MKHAFESQATAGRVLIARARPGAERPGPPTRSAWDPPSLSSRRRSCKSARVPHSFRQALPGPSSYTLTSARTAPSLRQHRPRPSGLHLPRAHSRCLRLTLHVPPADQLGSKANQRSRARENVATKSLYAGCCSDESICSLEMTDECSRGAVCTAHTSKCGAAANGLARRRRRGLVGTRAERVGGPSLSAAGARHPYAPQPSALALRLKACSSRCLRVGRCTGSSASTRSSPRALVRRRPRG